ncbi:hypothetical protein [Ignatzschineria cameli]|uniref:Phage tail tape measure protein n=1 Tax=Ignatzschineria cameli TaxID=2182793 RepID=A0ABX5L3D3_9GAMM|nr:hypothetical protein [Ignatzschineria cameli]PWD90340.1 hypothetical protein DC079_04150 [Ignatzschineria cameli]PWD92223.1 hypothetical protein DC081_03855 [Ignatzschineria cameli]PWD93017.1 hypothetical protein DC078_04150 [Ignatzschineria cameli]
MANNEMKTSVVVGFDDKQVTTGTRAVSRSIGSMARNMIRNTQRVNAQQKGLNKTFDEGRKQMMGYAKSLAATYGGVQAFKRTWEFNDALRELQRTTGISADELERYKLLLFDIQMQYGISKQAFSQYIDEVARGVKTYEELGEKARIGAIAIQGLGMASHEAVNFDWMMQEANALNPQAVLDRAVSIGQNGRFSGRELLSGVYDVMQDWSGPKDENTIYDLMTFLQLQSDDTQNIDDAVANFKALIEDLGSNRKFLNDRIGSDVFEKQDNELILKSLRPILDAIYADTKNGQLNKGLWYDQKGTLKGKLSEGGSTAVMSLAKKGDQFSEVRDSPRVDADAIALDRSRNFAESMQKLISVLERFADMNLAGTIDDISRAISELSAEDVQEFLNVAKEITKWVGGAYVAYKGLQFTAGAVDAAKTVFGNAAEVQKVFVTNMAEAREQGTGSFGASNMNKHAGALSVLANLQFALDRLSEDKEGSNELRKEYGDENINRWMDEQGYMSFMRNLDSFSFNDMKEVIAKGLLTDQYGAQDVTKVYQDQLPWYEPNLDLKHATSEELTKIIQDNAAFFMKAEEEVQGHVNVDSKITVEVKAAEGLEARVERQETKTESTIKSKLGYTGGGN